jgi:CMP-N-acetylneuraminic acid synthetase
MNIFDDITFIIPVREGSSRVQEKIYLPIGGKTLLEWKISQLKLVHPNIKIVVSSNSERVREIARKFDVGYHDRTDYLSIGHQASFSEVITGIVKDIKTKHFAWVTVVVPLMSPKEYLEGVKIYDKEVIQEKKNDSLVSVNLLKEYLWDDDKPINYRADKNHTISQDLPNVFRVTNGLYMSSKEETLKRGYFLGVNPVKHIVSKIAGIDIDEQEDYLISNYLYNYYIEVNGD